MRIAPETIHRHLAELSQRRSPDAALELFDALGYQYADELPVPTRNWPAGIQRLVSHNADPPIYLVKHRDFRVIYTHLTTAPLSRTVERPIVEHTLHKLHPFALFVFANRDLTLWDFVNVKYVAEDGLLDILVVHKLDRFSRSLRDTLNLMSDLCSWGVSFVSIQEQFDFTTPAGRLQMQILGAVAEWFSSNLGQEIAKGIHQRALEGLPWGRLPTGYCWGRCSECNDIACSDAGGEDRSDGEVPILHPVDSKAIRLAFETYSKGDQTCEGVAAVLNSAGSRSLTRNGRKPWTRNAVDKALRKRFYLGYVEHKGTLYNGKHEALIDEETFDRCERIRRQHCKAPRT